LLLLTTDQAASKESQTPQPRSTIRNLQSQDLFDFLKLCGCNTLAIPENVGEDDTTVLPPVAMVGSSDKADVEMELRRDILTGLLDCVRILGKSPTLQNDISG
jgi:hypothetical protein